MTVRQVFYRLVATRTIAKTESEYKETVVRLLVSMRLAGEVPFGWIADNTRWMRRPAMYRGLRQCLDSAQDHYRRDLWADQPAYVEIWLEKDALSGVVMEETMPWGVPLMVSRGFASITFLQAAAEAIAAVGKPAFLYQLGDHDPSGVSIPQSIERRLRQFAPRADITFRRLAVTPDQIAEFGLLTRPTKSTDSRARSFHGESVDVDAIPAKTLRAIVREAIEQHVDSRKLAATKRVEALERNTLAEFKLASFFDESDARKAWQDAGRGRDDDAFEDVVRAVTRQAGKAAAKFGPAEWRAVADAAKGAA